MNSFRPSSSSPDDAATDSKLHPILHPVYLLARDEDCENTFHHTADLVRNI